MQYDVSPTDTFWQHFKNYCHTIALWSQFAPGSHFVWDTKIKTFYNPFNNKAIIRESLVFCLIVTGIEANKDFLTLFLISNKIKQNVNNNKIPQYYGVTVIL